MPRVDKSIYLTFDDGPIPELTDWVLETLNEFEAKATFFCVGENVHKNPETFQRVVANGHSIGNHTHNHVNGRRESTNNYLKNVTECDAVFKANNLKTDLFRPPYGRFRIGQRLQLKNRKIVMWDVLSKDYDQSLNADIILKNCIKATEPGSIIVFHDNIKAAQNLKSVLPEYLSYFKEQGFQFKAI